MKSFLNKLKSKVHNISNKIKLNPKLQYTLYSIAGVIIITIILSLILAPLFTSQDFVRYKIKECFDKNNDNSQSPSEVNYAIVGDDLFMYYNFKQRCYEDLDIDHTITENNINIIVNTNNIEENCTCLSEVTAKIGPLEAINYTVNVYKNADGDKYIISTRNFTNEK